MAVIWSGRTDLNEPATLVAEVQKAREMNAPGIALFSGVRVPDYFPSPILDALREGPFAQPAPLPWHAERPE